MAVSPFKTFSAGEVLTAADLNSSITQITNNGTDVAFPLTKNVSAGGFVISSLGLGTVATDAASVTNCNTMMCEFRLTLTTVTPVTTADVNAATTCYMTPYKGNRIALFDGTYWHMRTSAELSFTTSGLAASKMYDVFCYDNSGTPALETLVWTNDTTRATALVLQDGVLVKSAATTRRYIGTIRTDVATTFYDSLAARYLWNYYNRVRRPMRVLEGTASWNYTTNTIRQANATTANQLDFVIGYNEELVQAEVIAAAFNSAGGNTNGVGIGLDSTTAFAAGLLNPYPATPTTRSLVSASLKIFPGVGRHYLAWLEVGSGVGTTTWIGVSGSVQSGIHGELMG